MTKKSKLFVQVTIVLLLMITISYKWKDQTHSEAIQPKWDTPSKVNKMVQHKEEQESPLDPIILRNLRRQSVSHDLAHTDVINMTSHQQELTIHSVLDNTDTVCQRKLRMGKLGDGGWEICDDADVRPQAPCIVYSFGINDDFSFDDDTALTYGCHVFSFDPSMKVESHNRSDLVHFYKIGLWSRTKRMKSGWNVYTFSDIRKLLGHENAPIDVVKLDIENYEWGAVDTMLLTGELKRFKQLLIEFHLWGKSPRWGYSKRLKLIQDLDKEGYRSFDSHKNMGCSRNVEGFPGNRTLCYEVHYLRRTGA